MKIYSDSGESLAHVHWGGAFVTGILFAVSFTVWVSL